MIDTLTRLNAVIDDCFGTPEGNTPGGHTADTKVSDLTSDSVEVLELILMCEEEFGVDLDGAEEVFALDKTLGDIAALIDTKREANG